MAKNFCPNCGVEVRDGMKFCPKCGNEISKLKKSNSKEKKEKNKEIEKQELKEEILEEAKEEIKEEIISEAKEEIKEEILAEAKDELMEEIKEESKNEIKKETKKEIKKETKDEIKSEIKEEIIEEAKDEIKDDIKSEIKGDEDVKIVPVPKKEKSNSSTIVIFLLVIVLLFVVWKFVLNKDEDSNTNNTDNEVVENENTNEENRVENDNDDEKNDVNDENNNNEENNDEDNSADKPVISDFKYYGNTYVYSEGFSWLKDSSYVYLVNESGKIVNKFDGSKYDGYYNFQNSNFKDGYAMIGNDLYNNKGELVKFDFEYDSVNYYGDGLAIVTVKEESYKGTVTKKGIYDLDDKKFVFELNETVYSISSLGEDMYLIYFNQEGRYVVYDARTNNSFYLGNRFDVLKTQYKDGYVIYQDTNANEVYAMDRNGNKKLVANNRRHASIGQYSDGLVFIGDAFYDINGTKVIDLKDEGVSNKPVFVNGYALVFFKTGYFTVLSKESKEYMFEPKAYTSMDNTYNGSFELGFYEDQTVVSNSGHLIVRFYDKELKTKHWSIINVKGEVVYDFANDISIKTVIADNGYIGVSSSKDNLSYYVSVNGNKLNISE